MAMYLAKGELLGEARGMDAGVNAATLLFMRNDPRRAIVENFILYGVGLLFSVMMGWYGNA